MRVFPFVLAILTGGIFSAYAPLYGQDRSADYSTAGPRVESGVSFALAQWRGSRVHTIAYELGFVLPRQRTSPVDVEETIKFSLSDNRVPLQLDFRKTGVGPDSLEVNGRRVVTDYRDEHLVIQPLLLREGENMIRLKFSAADLPLNRNGDFLYSLLVPDRARTLFACFDQPDCKAVFQLTLTAPRDWQVLANAPVRESKQVNDSISTTVFQPSDRISTYLFGFVAGKFVSVDSVVEGNKIRVLYRETDSEKIRLSIGPVFRAQAEALQFMQQYTGIGFPFKKFACAVLPDFQFGGMEHPGVIQYKASTLFLDAGATRDQMIARSNVLAHETAHMWFGDLVTMSWFNDVWMKEVFANFMADKIGNITLPDNHYALKFLTDHYPAAYSIDRTAGTHPIRQRLDNLQDAGSLYGNIIYHKAPIMMRQLELLMGEDAFRAGLREYLKTFAGGNASWADLIRIMGRHTKSRLESWNKVWVNEAGRPVFTYSQGTTNGGLSYLDIRQRGEDGSVRCWPQTFKIALVYKDHTEEFPVHMDQSFTRLSWTKPKPVPVGILFNSDGAGYGVFPADAVTGWIGGCSSPLMRASAYINLYENMLDGRGIRPMDLLALDRSLLAKEPEELCLNLLVDQLTALYWRWIPVPARDGMRDGLEKDCWNAMERVSGANEKKVLFKTFVNIALGREALDTLYAIWKQQRPPAGVQLAEDDYTALAATLAIKNYPGDSLLLQEQGRRIKNKDRAERWAFLLPALSADTAVRDAFFDRLGTASGRKKEAWVIAGLGYLHHPLRTGYSEKYLPRTLEWLEEVQRTGDVFFPQNWLGATLGWYRTRSAADVVHDFLDHHPAYNEKLRAKLLQSSDNLFRASRMGE